VIDEIARVLRAGGWLHLLSEDYGMLRMPLGARDPDAFWIARAALSRLDPLRRPHRPAQLRPCSSARASPTSRSTT
jgi:hypothetical protein